METSSNVGLVHPKYDISSERYQRFAILCLGALLLLQTLVVASICITIADVSALLPEIKATLSDIRDASNILDRLCDTVFRGYCE